MYTNKEKLTLSVIFFLDLELCFTKGCLNGGKCGKIVSLDNFLITIKILKIIFYFMYPIT